jgi:hypothetical protein
MKMAQRHMGFIPVDETHRIECIYDGEMLRYCPQVLSGSWVDMQRGSMQSYRDAMNFVKGESDGDKKGTPRRRWPIWL